MMKKFKGAYAPKKIPRVLVRGGLISRSEMRGRSSQQHF